MGKKTAIILTIILISGLAVLGYFLSHSKRNLFTDPYKAISKSACIVIETVDLQSFLNSLTTGKGLLGEAGKVKELDTFFGQLKFLTDLLNKSAFKDFLNNGSAIISFHPDEEGKLKPFLSMSLSRKIRFRHVKELLHSSGIKGMVESKSKGNDILKIPYTINKQIDTIHISLISGLMICSNSRELIEESRVQIGGENDIRSLPGFSKVLLASGKNQDKVFVVFANLPLLFQNILGAGSGDLAKKIVRLAGTSGGDIYLNEDGFVLSGYTESTDSSELLYRYKYTSPGEFQTYKILPSSTVLFETFAWSSDFRKGKADSIVSQATIDLGVKLKQYIGEEITRAYINSRGKPVSGNTLIIYELSNRIQAEQVFIEMLGSNPEILYFEPDEQIKIPVYKTGYKGLAGVFLPNFTERFDDIYFTFIDNYLISGSSFATVSRLLYDNMLHKTLANDMTYRDFGSTLPSRSGYFFYCVPSRIIDILDGYLNERIIIALRSNKNILNKIQAAGYQLASSNGMIYNSLSIRFKEEAHEESSAEWETLLDTVAGIKPFFFTNHITGAKEIFIQDIRNNTYLINAAGRVLWKVPLNEKIIGSVYMIDYYRNGKFQLLFSGRNYLHILDRNGNYVERYPVKLRSPATNSLALFDYDNNLNYRLFIAGEDKMIYSYDKTGNVVKGWKPFRTAGNVISELSYFKVSGKDYLVAADETSVYFLDRTGNRRLSLREPVTRANGSVIRLNPGSEPSVVCSSPDGTIQHIYFDGSVKKFNLKKFSSDHSFDIFDVDGDGFGEYIFIDKGILYLYDRNNSQVFTREFGSEKLGGPINFIFSASDRKIGVFDIDEKLIYLIDKKGKTMNGFPLRGASMFSIGKLSDKSVWYLIVGGTDRFLYNYKIETETK